MRPPVPAARSCALLAGLALALAGCERTNGTADRSSGATSAPSSPAAAGESAATPRTPDAGPTPLVPESEKGEAGARSVLLDFARAIELLDFDRAYAMLDDGAREKITREAFVALFDDLGEISVAVPPGRVEGAAGSLYYEVPTTITGSEGGKLTGTTVLRRVNDVPGATAEQLRWHIVSFEVAPD